MKYLSYKNKSVISTFFGSIVWTSLSTFILLAKNSIGETNIPVFELIIFISALIGVKIAHTNIKYSKTIVYDIFIETIFLIAIYISLYNSSLYYAGVSVYIVIIINGMSKTINSESARRYEDNILNKYKHKIILSKLRKKIQSYNTIAGMIGTSIAAICITILHIDIILFTKVMLILNIIQNLLDYYLWYKYLK